MAHVSNLVLFFDSYYFANLYFRFLIFRAWKVKLLVTQSCLTLCYSMDCSPPGSLSMEFSRQEYWSVLPFPSPGIFPTRGPNSGLLHWRKILYHLNHQGILILSIFKYFLLYLSIHHKSNYFCLFATTQV